LDIWQIALCSCARAPLFQSKKTLEFFYIFFCRLSRQKKKKKKKNMPPASSAKRGALAPPDDPNAKRARGDANHHDDGSGEEQRRHWSRPSVSGVGTGPLSFQQMDCDYVTGRPIRGMPGAQTGAVPVIRMFGITDSGNSVLCHVHGFTPYFYVPAPSGFAEEHCAFLGLFKEYLFPNQKN
jgi:hypothetical protein